MALLPILPVIPGESLASYVNRAAHRHGNTDVYRFLSLLELPRGAIVAPQPDQLHRISELFGLSPDTIAQMVFLPEGGRMRSICGERVHSEFAYLNKTSFCPACLLGDVDPQGASEGRRVGRIQWQIEAVRTCPVHCIPLYRRKNVCHSEHLQLMSEVAPEDTVLADLVCQSECRNPSALQSYIERRLNGERQARWLDDQPIDLAVRACEMLGVIMTEGTHCDLRAVTDAQWHKAGQLGFDFARRGEAGILEALEQVRSEAIAQQLRGGPQKVFGRLYQWFQFNKNNKPHGPIKDIVREYLLDHFPIEAGSELFGATVREQRIHTVHSLARKTGDHPKTINRAVVTAGLCDGDPDRPQNLTVFDLHAGESLMTRVRDSIPVTALPGYLNCNRTQAEQLVRRNVIPRLVPENPKATGVLKQVAIEDADRFLLNFMAAAKKVPAATDGMMDIVAAAEVSRWPVVDIVSGLLMGRFTKVECVDPELKFKGVLVDPEEVREVLSRHEDARFVGADEAARMAGLSRPALNALTRIVGPDGTPLLSVQEKRNANGAVVPLFPVEQLDAFVAEHISLKDYAAERSWSSKSLKLILERKGIKPIIDDHSLGRFYYRRSDLAA